MFRALWKLASFHPAQGSHDFLLKKIFPWYIISQFTFTLEIELWIVLAVRSLLHVI